MDTHYDPATPAANNIYHLAVTKHEIKAGDLTVNLGDYPPVAIDHIIARGIASIFGNEVASAVSDAKKRHKAAHGVDPDSSTIETWRQGFVQRKHKQLVDGDFTPARGGPRGTRVDSLARRYAVEEITAKLKVAGLSMPNGKDESVKFPDGSTLTREELIDRIMVKKGAIFRERAAKELAKLEDDAKHVVGQRGGAGQLSAEALGL